MARISFTSSTEEIIGKLGGNVFQDSYFGIQLRGLAKPRNPQTQLQQLRRGDFRFLSSSWRYLSAPDQATWITAAGTIPEALRLFIGNNINLILIGIDIISAYADDTAPPAFPLEIVQLSSSSFTIQASGMITVIPPGKRMLLYATGAKEPSKIFTNPSDYQPISFFDAGTDLSSPVEIVSDWIIKYGLLTEGNRICLKNVLIDFNNGNRGIEEIICSIIIIMANLFGVDDNTASTNRQFQLNDFLFHYIFGSGTSISYLDFQGSDSDPYFDLYLDDNAGLYSELYTDKTAVEIYLSNTSSTSNFKVHADTIVAQIIGTANTFIQVNDGSINHGTDNGSYTFSNMVDAIDDTAAAAAGVPINGLYHNAGAVRIRLT